MSHLAAIQAPKAATLPAMVLGGCLMAGHAQADTAEKVAEVMSYCMTAVLAQDVRAVPAPEGVVIEKRREGLKVLRRAAWGTGNAPPKPQHFHPSYMQVGQGKSYIDRKFYPSWTCSMHAPDPGFTLSAAEDLLETTEVSQRDYQDWKNGASKRLIAEGCRDGRRLLFTVNATVAEMEGGGSAVIKNLIGPDGAC